MGSRIPPSTSTPTTLIKMADIEPQAAPAAVEEVKVEEVADKVSDVALEDKVEETTEAAAAEEVASEEAAPEAEAAPETEAAPTEEARGCSGITQSQIKKKKLFTPSWTLTILENGLK